jgi:ABC-type ATPase involved in cell division
VGEIVLKGFTVKDVVINGCHAIKINQKYVPVARVSIGIILQDKNSVPEKRRD